MPPETIAGRYRVEREVGRGGMGSVWLCRDELLGRVVAVKQVGHLPGESTPDLARAMREARSSAALNHRNVVSIYDAIEEGDRIWLVMEYVPGRTLSQIMAQDGPLPPERAAWIGAQVAEGLAAAHEQGTMHRDVKPGNILVTDDDLAKISDFGIARTLGDTQLTQSGLVTGTPAYFSPGLARGGDPTAADDVWALGATLYAAVEGRPPYREQRNAIAQLSAIASDRPPRPERAGVLAEPIGRMMDPDPGSRWVMADAAHALRRLHEKHNAGGTREQTAPVAPVAPPPGDGPAAVAPPVAPTDATDATDVPPEPAPAPAPARAPDRRRRGPLLLGLLGVLVLLGLVYAGSRLLPSGTDEERGAQAAPTGGGAASRDSTAGSGGATEPTDPGSAPSTARSSSPAQAPSRSGFVESYYGVLPDDTEAGYAMLSPGYRARTSYADYQGFWSTIDSVTVDGTAPAGGGAVDVTLTYTSDGGTDHEVRRIHLQRTDDGYLISDDEIVG